MEYEAIVQKWRQRNLTKKDDLQRVLSQYAVDFAYHSGKIENDEICLSDVQQIFETGQAQGSSADARTLLEIQNAKKAYLWMLDAWEQKRPITQDFVKELHKTLMQGVYDAAKTARGEQPGAYKRHDYVVGEHETGAPPEDVAQEMQELLEEVQSVAPQHVFTAAAYLHAKLENIHPFADGNGRTGRLLTNYFLLCNGHPPLIVHEQSRTEYYAALGQFDTHLQLGELKTYLKKQLLETWAQEIFCSVKNGMGQ